MDDLDVRIIKELGSPNWLQWNVRETYSSIARRIGVDEETVRRRLKRAERLGSVTGWRMMVNPLSIRCRASTIDLDVADEEGKAEAIAEVRRVDGVVKILDFRGRGLQTTLYHKDGNALREKIELISSITGSKKVAAWELVFPHPDVRMTAIDWQIVMAMLDDARKSLRDVSDSVGVSIRTVERRLMSMTEGRVVYLQGNPNFRMLAGLSCVFLVYCPDERRKKAADDAVVSKLRRSELSNTASKRYSTFVTLYDNLSEADDTATWIRGLDGVESVKLGIMNELFVIQDWLRSEVKRVTAQSVGLLRGTTGE